MSKNASNENRNRLIYLDNLKLFLIILVILHHAAVAYGGSGSWPLKENATDGISPIIFTLFNGVNQSFFMALFFLISGFFVPGSFDKKGAKKFLKDKLIRLGVPIIVYATLLNVILEYILLNFAEGTSVTFMELILYNLVNPSWNIGPLWFVEALLIFSAVYAFYRILIKSMFIKRIFISYKFNPFSGRFPSNNAVIASIILIAALAFFVRIFYPVGAEFHVFQLGHFVSYIFCFWLGILAYRGRWLDSLTDEKAKLWKIVAVLIIISLPVIMVLTGADKNVEPFLGGLTWQSVLFSVWESIACLSIIISLINIFNNRFSTQGKILSRMAPNSYTVYIIHQIVLVSVMILFLSAAIPTYIKFILVSLIGIVLCFIISDLIRRIPCAKKVL